MPALAIIRLLQKLKDVDPNGLPNDGVPQYQTAVSSFVVQTIAGGGGGSFSLGASNLGNTLGDTGVTGSRVVLAGIGNLTLSQATDANGGTISISAGTAAAAGGVAVSASNSLFSSGTVVLTGAGGGATVNTVAPGTIQISVAAPVAQTVQTQDRFDLTVDGNTAGVLALVSSGTLTLAGGNSITISQNGNAITISGATTSQSVQTQPIQTGISSIVASNATYTSGSVQFTGSGIVTVRSSANQRVVIDASQSVQTQNAVDVTLAGNTAGALALVSSGTMTLAGGNNITLSQAGNAITISGPAAAGAQTAISGIIASDTTYTSGSVRFTGVGGGVTVSSNTGQRVDISVAAPVAQTGTQFSMGLTNSGNTSGDTGTVGGRLLLVGTNNITLSGSTNGQSMTITMSGPSVAGAQTGISGIANSQTTYTSGTVSLSELGAITIRSTTGNQFQLSVAAQTAESQSIGMSNIGNTSGTTGIASGAQVRFLLAGGNGVTLSQSLNGASGTLTISVASQTVESQSIGMSNIGNTSGTTGVASGGQVRFLIAGGNNITLSQSLNGASGTLTISGPNAQTGLSGLANSQTTYTSGTVSMSELGAITIRSTTGNQFQFSVNAQSVQPETQTFIGGIANTETTYTSGTVKLLELGAITIRSTTGNQFQLSVNAQTGTQFSAGISGGNTLGDTGTVAGRVVLAGGANITLSGSTNGASETITIVGPAAGAFSAGVSNVGNTSGDTGITGSRLVLAGGNNITLSQSTNASGGTVTISAFTQSAESQSIGMSNLGNTSGTTGIASGAQVRMLFAGGNNITLSQSLNGASGTLTISAPNAQTAISGIAASNTTYTSGTITITGVGGGVTVSSNTGQRVDISVAAPVAQTGTQFSAGLSNLGNTAGDTVTVGGRLILAGSNGITLSGSSNGASQTITISGITQSAESQSIGMSNLGNTSGTTGIASGAQVRMLFAGAGEVTLSQSLNGASGTLTISSPVQTVESQSIGMSNIGNTSGTTGIASGGQVRFLFAGGNNITLSQSLNGASGTITISAPNLGAGAMSAGVSNLGNSAGATGITGTQLVFVGSDNITLSQTTGANGGTVSIIGGAGGGFSAGVSTGGNTAGATGVTGTRMVLVGTNAISLSQTTGAAGATLSIDAPATSSLVGASGISISTNGSTISVYQPNRTQFYPFNDIPIVTGQQGQATLHIAPIHFPNIQHDRLLLGMQMSNATNSSNSITVSAWAGIYSKNASSISLISSISTSTNFSGSGTVGSYSLYGGPKWLSLPWTNTITENDYWFGIVIRTTTGGGAGHIVSQLCVSKFTNSAWSGIVGAASGATDQYQLGLGVYTVSTSGIPSVIAFTEINGSGSMALREPIFQLRSGTV